jgi:NAD(P)-dependent dehydrogenase (short-subunit alcohol dehydrogenase family)
MPRVAVVTGAAGGIGRATVELFRDDGWLVVGIDRDEASASAADRFVAAELANEASLQAAIDALGDLGHIDALINNAAVSLSRRLVDMSSTEWDSVMAVNVRAAFLATRHAHPMMKGRGAAVVNVGSVHALATTAGVSAYAASKGALVALTRAAALELAADGIRVNAVLPGAVDTPMLRRADDTEERLRSIVDRTPLGRVGDPREIAQAILFLADGERSSFITGTAVVADGGALARLATE